ASGFDAYMLKSCLHDWQDAKSVEILRRCRDAMPDHGHVLIVEIVLAPGRPIGHPHRLIDLEMMVTLGGKERSEQEFAALLAQAGLRLTAVTRIPGSFFSVVEALANSDPQPVTVDFAVMSEILVLGERLGGRSHGLYDALNGILGHIEGELAGLDLGDVEHGVDETQE